MLLYLQSQWMEAHTKVHFLLLHYEKKRLYISIPYMGIRWNEATGASVYRKQEHLGFFFSTIYPQFSNMTGRGIAENGMQPSDAF